jgi:hypothetical protein
MTASQDVVSFQARLAETIAWCEWHASTEDPENSLRTADLHPAKWGPNQGPWSDLNDFWGTQEYKVAVVSAVEALATARAGLLRQANVYPYASLPPNLSGGRLLLATPDESDLSGLSEWESGGLINALDIPPWDTWVSYVHEQVAPHDWVAYLLCWIPTEFIPLVERGILVNPVECFFWASDYKQHDLLDSEFLRLLDRAGFIG